MFYEKTYIGLFLWLGIRAVYFLPNKYGVLDTSGTNIDKIMPPISLFGNSGRESIKKNIISKIKAFFDKYLEI